MFTNDSVVLLDFIKLSNEDFFCLVATYYGDVFPIKNCSLEKKRKWQLVGIDPINNIKNTIAVNDIKEITSLSSKSVFAKKTTEYYTKLTNFCSSNDIEINKLFFYKKIPLHEKTISIILNKAYDDVSFEELTDLWKTYIKKHSSEFAKKVKQEILTSENTFIVEQREALLVDIQRLSCCEEILSFKEKEALIKFWPKLLSPLPLFVKQD